MTAVCYGLYFLLSQIDNHQTYETHKAKINAVFSAREGLMVELTNMCASFNVLVPFISDAIIKPISEVIGQPVMMYHRHDDLIEEKEALTEPQACNCSIVQLLLRLTPKVNTLPFETMVKNFFISMFPSLEFKYYLRNNLIELIRFFPLQRTKPDSFDSPMTEVSTLLISTFPEDAATFIFEPKVYLGVLVNLAKTSGNDKAQLQFALKTFIKILEEFPQYVAPIIDEEENIELLMEVLLAFNGQKFEFSAVEAGEKINEDNQQVMKVGSSASVDCDHKLIEVMNKLLRSALFDASDIDRKTRIKKLMTFAKNALLKTDDQDYQRYYGFTSITLERVLIMCICAFLFAEVSPSDKKFDVVDVNTFELAAVNEVLLVEGDEDSKKVYKFMLASFSRVVGFMREVTRGLWVNLV